MGKYCFSRLSRSAGKYSEDQTRFYAAQVTLAFEYLHYLSLYSIVVRHEDVRCL